MQLFYFVLFYTLVLILEILIFVVIPFQLSIFVVLTQVVSFIIGIYLLRNQDVFILTYLDTELKKNNLIVYEMWDESLLVLSGILFVLIGVFSDIIACLLLFEKVRNFVIKNFLFDRTI